MFECDRCGLCCRNIGKIPELSAYHKGDGICVHLTKDNLCDIYNSRPDICNVSAMYEQKYNNMMSREEYDALNHAGCIALKNQVL